MSDPVQQVELDPNAQPVPQPVSWLGFKLINQAAADEMGATVLPSDKSLSGRVWLALTDSDGDALYVAGIVVGVSFTAAAVRYSVAFPVAPQPRQGETMYAVVDNIESGLVLDALPDDETVFDAVLTEDAAELLPVAAVVPVPAPVLDSAGLLAVGRLEGELAERVTALKSALATDADPMYTLGVVHEVVSLTQQVRAGEPAPVVELDPTEWPGYAEVLRDEGKAIKWQDRLDSFFQERLVAVRNALRGLGWTGEQRAALTKNGIIARFDFWQVGAGKNVVGMTINGIRDDLTKNVDELAAAIDATAALPEPAPVALNNVPSAELKAAVLRVALGDSKGVEPVENGKYLAATMKGTGRGIYVVDGIFDRATYKAVVVEAREAGLDPNKLSVYGRLGPYSSDSVTFTNLNDYPALQNVAPEPSVDELAEPAGPSDQFGTYRTFIEKELAEGRAIPAGMLEIIRMDTRLNDGEAEQLEALAAAPASTSQEKRSMEQLIKIAADSLAQLRRIDVYRVLNSAGDQRAELATFIATGRADLVREVTDVMAEEWPDLGWTFTAPAVVERSGGGGELLVPNKDGKPKELDVPPIPPEAKSEQELNPARSGDMAFLNGVISQSVDMWDDALADKIEGMAGTYENDAEVMELVGRAINSYTDFMLAAA